VSKPIPDVLNWSEVLKQMFAPVSSAKSVSDRMFVSSGFLRPAEWFLLAYFSYVAIASTFFPLRPSVVPYPFIALAVVVVIFGTLAFLETRIKTLVIPILRDWLPLVAVILAYREMDWFTPAYHDHHLEATWIVWDRQLLHQFGLQRLIELPGPIIAWILEFSYLLVYTVGPFSLAVLYCLHKTERSQQFLLLYLVGTLFSYGCFPYFPSEPPRTVYPGADMPTILTWFRKSNLSVVGNYGIHSSVFPSAHVSSAFSAAFGMLRALPERRSFGIGLLIYGSLVAIATVYGRYHYAVDAVAGVGIAVLARQLTRRRS
jgi:membrane-associated phospholipid phosphatase